MTTQEKVQELTRDFLERDGDKFIKIRRTGRLGWEGVLPEAGVYSSYITEVQNKEDLITRAYAMACNMITVMDAPEKVKIDISAGTSCCGPGVIHVETKVFDDDDLSNGQKLDVFIGLAVHEGCHLLYTDMSGNIKYSNDTVKALENIIEDERIERICGEVKPGLANFLGAAKYYVFNKCFGAEEQERASQQPDHIRLINTILAYVRYPKSLLIRDVETFADELLEVKRILTPYPESTAESARAAEEIYKVIERYFQKEEEKKRGEASEWLPNNTIPSNDGDEKMEEVKDIISQLGSRAPGSFNDMRDVSEAIRDRHVARVVMGEAERGLSNRDCLVEKAAGNKQMYLYTLANVKSYIPAISKALQVSSTELQFCVTGAKNGKLDTNKLAEAVQGVESVYKRQGEVKSSKIAVAILVDESGSMYGSNADAAREAAILLNEALSRVQNVDLYIYGHTTLSKGRTQLFAYRERGCANDKFALGSLDARAGNHDSVAIREVAARVRKHTQEKCLFFVISDGAPNEGPSEVKRAVNDVTRKGFDILAISIEPEYDPSSMYKNNIILNDLRTLAIDLGKVIKKAVKSNTNRSIFI